VKKPGLPVVDPGTQSEAETGVGKVVLGRVVVACRISQIEGTEKSASLFVSEVCRA
jgi:hypothetical protein